MRDRYRERNLAPDKRLMAVKAELEKVGLDQPLVLMIYLLTSLINGCGYCIKLHTGECQEAGVAQSKLDALANWCRTDVFSERELAVFAWTEAMTRLAKDDPSDSVYETLKIHFSGDEIVNLSIAISTMNALNRMAISFRLDVNERG
jgi:AhpD family alkylhydroperoxidase